MAGQADNDSFRSSPHLAALRPIAVVAWIVLILAFWLLLSGSAAGPLELLRNAADGAARTPSAPLLLLGLYALRPLLLVPITVLNLASGFALGAAGGIPLALVGTLVSASMGYAIGRMLGTEGMMATSTRRWRFVRFLRERGFEAVAAGGLIYLHADLVNLPAGMLRLSYPSFLLGITVGNSLTLTMAVLAAAAIDVDPIGSGVSVSPEYVAAAAVLFLVSLVVARLIRRRLGTGSDLAGGEGASE